MPTVSGDIDCVEAFRASVRRAVDEIGLRVLSVFLPARKKLAFVSLDSFSLLLLAWVGVFFFLGSRSGKAVMDGIGVLRDALLVVFGIPVHGIKLKGIDLFREERRCNLLENDQARSESQSFICLRLPV